MSPLARLPDYPRTEDTRARPRPLPPVCDGPERAPPLPEGSSDLALPTTADSVPPAAPIRGSPTCWRRVAALGAPTAPFRADPLSPGFALDWNCRRADPRGSEVGAVQHSRATERGRMPARCDRRL